MIAAGCVCFLFVSIAGFALVFRAEVPTQSLPAPQLFPEPRFRVDEAAQRLALEAQQRAQLDGYRWIDREKKIVGIPISRAMELIARRGADAYNPIPDIAAAPKAAP
jgi:hypothetical protein